MARCYTLIINALPFRARRASPLQSLAEARLNTRKQVKDLRLRVRAFGVYSVNALFTSYHEIIAHNANIRVMRRRARRASPVHDLT